MDNINASNSNKKEKTIDSISSFETTTTTTTTKQEPIITTTRNPKHFGRALEALNAAYETRITPGCETTLIVTRHCNDMGLYSKDDFGNKHCSYLGYEQSYYMATLFGDNDNEKWPTPSYLFALMFHQIGGFNFRQWETLKPLSEKSGVPIQNIDFQQFYDKYIKLLNTGNLCGKLSVAPMKHDFIPDIPFLFGCGPRQGCLETYDDSEFDQVVQLKFVYGPKPQNNVYSVVFNNETNRLEEEEETTNNNTTTTTTTMENDSSQYSWRVYGSVTKLHFDPLTFSKQAGDYPQSGTSQGGRWQAQTTKNTAT